MPSGTEGSKGVYEGLLSELAKSFGKEGEVGGGVKPGDILMKWTKTSKLLATFFSGMREVPSLFEGFMSKKGEDNTRWKVGVYYSFYSLIIYIGVLLCFYCFSNIYSPPLFYSSFPLSLSPAPLFCP